jgi:P4 family phage/plasmid primase-like protien
MVNNEQQKRIKKKIEGLLNENKTKTGQTDYTHISMGGNTFPGKFTFSDKKTKAKLNKLLAQAYDNNLFLSIAERPKDYSYIKVDIDMNYPIEDNSGERLYDQNFVFKIAEKYRESIKKYCNVENDELNCILFEKEKVSEKNGEIKDGFHLIFPNIILYYKTRHLIVDDVIKKCNNENLFDKYVNADVIDKAVVSSLNWLMYGCCKPNKPLYKITKYFNHLNEEMDMGLLGDSDNILKTLSLRQSKFKDTNQTKIKPEYDDTLISETYSELGVKKEKEDVNIISEEKMEVIEKAVKLVDLFSNKRSNDYHSWLRVGWALHNTHPTLLDTWVNFSKRSKKYKDGECETMWTQMKDDGYTIRSLMLWAKEDSPDEYKNLIKEYFNNILKSNDIDNTFSVAKALQCKYSDMFVCADVRDNLWYYYENHKWNKTNNGGRLITMMSNDFSNYYLKKSQEYSKKAMNADSSLKKTLLDEGNKFQKIGIKLLDINYKEKIMKEARYLFFEEGFKDRLDEKLHLIGFTNGVYDLKLKKFREGQPDDHISMNTNVYYKPYSADNPYMKHINKFFEQVLVNKNIRNYFLTRLSTCVSGENREEKVYFCTGSGSNGKSLTFKLVKEALGDYYISCPITIITKKRNASNAASPELARMKGPRCGVFQEPGESETINVGIFKELSGNDSFMVRGLYQEPAEITPQLKYWLACNDLPQIPSDDGGTWRRIRVIDFASKFVDNPDKNNPNEFKLDEKLKDKIISWAPAFVSYLIHIYTTQYDIKSKANEPDEVKLSTNKYRQEQDIIREYYDSMIEITNDPKDKLMKSELKERFKAWAKSEHENTVIPKITKLYDIIEKGLKQQYHPKKGWKGICIQEEEDSEESANELDV